MTNISVVGLGPVGLCSAVAFATQGHRVIGFDIDTSRRDQVSRGEPPFYEKGIREALRKVLRAKRFSVVDTMDAAIEPAAVVFLCVGTPSREDGSMDDSGLRAATKSIAAAWRDGKRRTVVVKSTVLPGTTDHVVRPILEASGRPFRLGVNPEFLREGRALEDALRPDRVVLGADGPETARILKSLYRSAKCPVLATDLKTAEAVKYATNSFLATKVAFADELANLCDALGVSYDEVLDQTAGCQVVAALYDPAVPNNRFAAPNKLFEAMMFEKPVLVSEGTLAADIVREVGCGIVVPYGDREALKRALEKLMLSSEEASAMGARGRAAFEQRYNWKAMEPILLQLYREELQANAPRESRLLSVNP